MLDKYIISNLPPYGKLFVGFFVVLMLTVTIWAAWLYTIEKGEIDPNNLPSYMKTDELELNNNTDLNASNKLDDDTQLRENLGLAHTHINGQTLLYFALGLVFLFSSAKPKVKTILYILFAFSILMHTVGLSGESFHWFFDDILAFSGFIMLIVIAYMSFIIFIDLFKGKAHTA